MVLSHFSQCVSLCLLQDMASSQGQCQLGNLCSGCLHSRSLILLDLLYGHFDAPIIREAR